MLRSLLTINIGRAFRLSFHKHITYFAILVAAAWFRLLFWLLRYFRVVMVYFITFMLDIKSRNAASPSKILIDDVFHYYISAFTRFVITSSLRFICLADDALL